MITALFSRLVILAFGLLLPAYKSYKTTKSDNGIAYREWLIYWIVFALYMCVETFTDIFLSWFPFYYEIKLLFVAWLLCPFTRGAQVAFATIIRPQIAKREKEIDGYLSEASKQVGKSLHILGNKGSEYVVQTLNQGKNKLLETVNEASSPEPADPQPTE